MRRGYFIYFSLCLLALPGLGLSHSRRGPTGHRVGSRHSTRGVLHAASVRTAGQHSIDDVRAAQLQTALTGAGYLSGEQSGHWDASTEAAMQKFQADNGWQTKLMPDSRAIIKLGLGPKHVDQGSFSQQSVPPGPAI